MLGANKLASMSSRLTSTLPSPSVSTGGPLSGTGAAASVGPSPNASQLLHGHAWNGLVDLTGATVSASSAAREKKKVRYGDAVRLFARSGYLKPESNVPGGYVGYYFRSRKGAKGEEQSAFTGKEHQLAILSPAGPDKENLYHESHFHVVDPNGVKQDGDCVRLGEEFVLVDDRGMSWNVSASEK